MVKKSPNEPIRITSASQCLNEFDLLKQALSIEETEDTWQNIDSSLQRFTAAVRGGACDYPDQFLKHWKETEIVRGLVSAMSTERTRLSGTALDLVGATSRLGSHWDSAVPFYVPTIIKLLGRASKIYVTRATIALNSLIKGTKSLVFIPYLIDGISEKSLTIRVGCADALLCCLTGIVDDTNLPSESGKPKPASRDNLSKRLTDIENAIKIGGRDRDPKVRATFKRIWELYQQQWPTRAVGLAQPFTPTIKRYLGIAPNLASSAPVVPAPSGRSQNALTSNNGFTNPEAHPTREKAPGSSHSRTGSRNLGLSQPPPANTINHHPSKLTKSHNSHVMFPKPGDLITLPKATVVPFPKDEPECLQAPITRGPARARLLSARDKAPLDGSLLQAQPSGSTMKRSNSTMRAQRVPLPSQGDLPAAAVNGSTRTATRAPLQPIQPTNHPLAQDLIHTKSSNMATVASTNHQSSTRSLTSKSSTNFAKVGFKPTRTISGTAEVDSKPPPQSQPPSQQPLLQTRPLPRRAVAEPPPLNDIPTSAPAVSNTLNVSVRSNPHSRKVQASEGAQIVKQTRKAFKPTKSCSKTTSNAGVDAASKPSSITTTNSNLTPVATSHENSLPSQASKPLVVAPPIPELLQLPASIPLPPSPGPPETSLASTQPRLDPGPQPRSEPPTSSELQSQPPLEPPSLSKPLPSSDFPAEPLPLPEDIKSEHGMPTITNDRIAPTAATDRTVSHQLPPNHSNDVAQQSLFNPHPQPQSFPLISGTPGPKICTRLPDDLIVPMSVPLPPSPNSPFLQLSKVATSHVNRKQRQTKANQTHRTPRSITTRGSSRSTSKNANSKLKDQHGRVEPPCPSSSVCSKSETDEDPEVTLTQPPIVPEGILVDFDHEDTIWIPRPPALHEDLVQLNPGLSNGSRSQQDSDDGEDGPEGKRRRLLPDDHHLANLPSTSSLSCDSKNPTSVQVEGNTTIDGNRDSASLISKTTRRRIRRRDPSLFNFNQAQLERIEGEDGDDSGERTISCLKEEQPTFLAGDITVSEGISFYNDFVGGIHPHNQSTPASAVLNLNHPRRFHTSQISSP